MNDQDLLARITTNPSILSGKPVISGTRLSVEFVVNLLVHGAAISDVVREYDGLQDDDIHACLLFAANSVSKASFMPLTAESA